MLIQAQRLPHREVKQPFPIPIFLKLGKIARNKDLYYGFTGRVYRYTRPSG